jgi:hypothetical protein
MDINGLEGLTIEQLAGELKRGGRFVIFHYVVSIVIVTFRRPSAIYYVSPGQGVLSKGWPYVLLSALLGWWGVPFGLIYTPVAIVKNLAGGTDVTAQVMDTALGQKVREAQGHGAPTPPPLAPQVQAAPAVQSPPAAPTVAGPVCPNCGSTARAGAVVCGRCGARLGEADLPTVEAAEEEAGASECPACGEPIEPGWSVCPACATPLDLKCPECGESVEREWRTCPFCEADLAPAA